MVGQVESTIVTLRRSRSDAAHQLHTLSPLRTNPGAGSHSPKTPSAAEHLPGTFPGQVARLTNLTDELLQLARRKPGIGAPRSGSTWRRWCVVRLRRRRRGRAGHWRSPGGAGPFPWVVGSWSNSARWSTNLVDNALKFTPGGRCG